MLSTVLSVSGEDFSANAAARRLRQMIDLSQTNFSLVKVRTRKGDARDVLRLVLSDDHDAKDHLKQICDGVDKLLSFIAAEKARHGNLSIYISTAIGVGDSEHFTRSFGLTADFLAKLAALGINYETTAYSCCD